MIEFGVSQLSIVKLLQQAELLDRRGRVARHARRVVLGVISFHCDHVGDYFGELRGPLVIQASLLSVDLVLLKLACWALQVLLQWLEMGLQTVFAKAS